MIKNYFVKNYSKILVFCTLIFSSLMFSQTSFLIGFTPANTSEPITVCNGTATLTVNMSVADNTTQTSAAIIIQLAPGVEYVPGSLLKKSGTSSLTITENGGTANAPKFTLAKPSGFLANENISFEIKRTANCNARTHQLSGGTFADTVSGTISGFQTTTASSPNYFAFAPVLTFTQPAAQTNAILNTEYTRVFSVTNGGNGCTTNIYLGIDYGTGTQQTSLTLNVGGTQVALTPTSTVGNIRYYTISSSQLPTGDLCNGETITFTEKYKLLQCNATTNYSAGWGCSSAPGTWCETKTGTGSTSMASGVPNMSEIYFGAITDFVDSCTPFTVPVRFSNTGSGNPSAAGLYNVNMRLGGGSALALGNFAFNYYNIVSVKLNGTSIPVVNGTSNGIVSLNFKNLFPTTAPDPDGVGVGLADLDGDGFYDDLPGGAQLNLVITFKINCSYFTACNAEDNGAMTYGIYADAQYNTICDASSATTTATSTKITGSGPGNKFSTQFRNFTNASYAPTNIVSGTPFNARFAVSTYSLVSPFDTNDTRYQFVVTLPSGLDLSGTGNIKWYKGYYGNSTLSTVQPTVTKVGNVLTVTSPDKFAGYFTIDLVYTCGPGAPINIPFKFNRLDNIVTGCLCNSELKCHNLVLTNVLCPGPCTQGAASINSVKVERANNSLGWTDHTLTTLQTRANISSYDLSKAMYLDDIEVSANGVQSATQNNLFLKISLYKLTGPTDKLLPKSIDVRIIRSGSVVASGTISTFTTTGTSTTEQVVIWNLTSLLPGGQIIAGDQFETKSYYTVTALNSSGVVELPTNDTQIGKTIYFYNVKSNGEEISCNNLVPEMYLVKGTFVDGANNTTVTGCTSTNIGANTNTYAYRFDSTGNKYESENRPGLKPLTYSVTIPTDYTLDKVIFTKFLSPNVATDITSSLVRSGNTYTYTFTEEVGYNVPVTNNYNFAMAVYVYPSCSSPANGRSLDTKLEYIPYYYHYKTTGPLPVPIVWTKPLAIVYNTTTRPAISLANQSGIVQASKPIEFGQIKVTSSGTTTAPYVWIAIPTTTGVQVQSVTDVATGTVLSPITYSGGVWFQLTNTGIASGLSRDYRINFKYTTCSQTSFPVFGGWNCAAYPSDPGAYTCTTPSANITFIPQPASIQLEKVSEPQNPVNMCQIVDFKYAVLSAGAGNAINNKLALDIPAGLTFVPGTLQVEYPYNSGNWAAVTSTISGSVMTMDLSTHPQFPISGLPGTLNDGGNINNRKMGVRFQTKTSCTFAPNSIIKLTSYANSTCGAPANGNGVVTNSVPIKIIGADAEYLFSSTFVPTASFDNCASNVQFNIEQTLVAQNPIGSSGEVHIEIPAGYNYASISCTSTSCPTYLGNVTDATTNKTYATFSVPGGMNGGEKMIYNVVFSISSTPPACGNYTIEIKTIDKKSGIICVDGNQPCPAIAVNTGSTTYSYSIVKPSYSIPSLTGTINGTNFTGTIGVTNTSTMASSSANPIKVRFYCADSAGNQGVYLGTYTLAGTIVAGATVTQNFNITIGTICATSRIIAAIETPENCACSAATGMFYLSCFKPGTLVAGDTNPTKHGITSLGRAGANNGNWPMVRNSAWTVLESQTKGFVVNRLTDAQVSTIPAGDLKEGMMLYNITQQCLMINVDGTAAGWKCYKNPACPDQ